MREWGFHRSRSYDPAAEAEALVGRPGAGLFFGLPDPKHVIFANNATRPEPGHPGSDPASHVVSTRISITVLRPSIFARGGLSSMTWLASTHGDLSIPGGGRDQAQYRHGGHLLCIQRPGTVPVSEIGLLWSIPLVIDAAQVRGHPTDNGCLRVSGGLHRSQVSCSQASEAWFCSRI
jgi:hypothetical protein